MTKPDSALATGFIEARFYGKGPRTRGPITLLVVHATASAEKPDAAESTAKWFAAKNTRHASANYSVDDREIWQSVLEADIAWGAAGVNHRAIHLEHVGQAAQKAAQWADTYSTAELALSAPLAADVCRRNRLPARRLTIPQLQSGVPGITDHATVSLAFPKVSTGHTDPGPFFPWDRWLADVQRHLSAGTIPVPLPVTPPALPFLRFGAVGPAVERLQRLLKLRVNGSFGSATRGAVETLQRHAGLPVTGEVDPATWAALGVKA